MGWDVTQDDACGHYGAKLLWWAQLLILAMFILTDRLTQQGSWIYAAITSTSTWCRGC